MYPTTEETLRNPASHPLGEDKAKCGHPRTDTSIRFCLRVEASRARGLERCAALRAEARRRYPGGRSILHTTREYRGRARLSTPDLKTAGSIAHPGLEIPQRFPPSDRAID